MKRRSGWIRQNRERIILIDLAGLSKVQARYCQSSMDILKKEWVNFEHWFLVLINEL